jgi:hypothetical protein
LAKKLTLSGIHDKKISKIEESVNLLSKGFRRIPDEEIDVKYFFKTKNKKFSILQKSQN